MSIKVVNEIYSDRGEAKEVVFCLHLPFHLKHSNHLTRGEDDCFEWGIGGKCDNKTHKVSCKVNIPNAPDKHPEIEAANGETIRVVFTDGEYRLCK